LRSNSIEHQRKGIHHDQNSNTALDRVRNSNAQKSNSGSCSSSYIYKTTTTTTDTDSPSNFTETGDEGPPLIYPARLSENHRELAAHYLANLTPEQRQAVLDELEGRIQAEASGMKPVYDEISFLNSLCKLTRQGKFRPNLGIKVRDQRREQERRRARPRDDSSTLRSNEGETQRHQRMELGLVHLAEMRKVLGVKGDDNNQNLDSET
jgi:hypothetical protein